MAGEDGRATKSCAALEVETEHNPDFLLFTNALSALYPKDREGELLLNAMILIVPT